MTPFEQPSAADSQPPITDEEKQAWWDFLNRNLDLKQIFLDWLENEPFALYTVPEPLQLPKIVEPHHGSS